MELLGQALNRFFGEPHLFELPSRVYARAIDSDGATVGRGDTYLLFDAIDAAEFDAWRARYGDELPQQWPDLIEQARIFAIEINSRGGKEPNARSFLMENRFTRWVEINSIKHDPNGPAEIYNTIGGVGLRITFQSSPLSFAARTDVKKATSIRRDIKTDAVIRSAIPSATIDQVFVLDVGQGSANALADRNGHVVGYVDLGTGVLADASTWPPAGMTHLCLHHNPIIVLTHWHYDHFEAANKFPAAKTMTWIAPFQTLGPGPQSAMAYDIKTHGTLMVWNGTGRLSGAGPIELERCTGPAGDQNRTGITVWIEGPKSADPILLPGDAGYSDIPSLATRAITAFVVSHHGGRAPGTPPADPGGTVARAALSFGNSNSYGHPLAASLTGLGSAGWSIGVTPGWSTTSPTAAGIDDRFTPALRTNIGHVGLKWPGSTTPTRHCSCACSIDPIQ